MVPEEEQRSCFELEAQPLLFYDAINIRAVGCEGSGKNHSRSSFYTMFEGIPDSRGRRQDVCCVSDAAARTLLHHHQYGGLSLLLQSQLFGTGNVADTVSILKL